jgi:hypothetical protein
MSIWELDLQDVVDALAERVGSPVAVEDAAFHLLAYSAHQDGVDEVRVRSILDREAPAAVTGWLRELGVHRAESVTRVCRNGRLGMEARLCFPVRFQRQLLGYLWLLDRGAAVSDATTIAAGAETAEHLSALLGRRRAALRADRERERELVGQLLSADASVRSQASEALVGGDLLASTPKYAGLALHVGRGQRPADLTLYLDELSQQLRRRVDPGHLLEGLRTGALVYVLAMDPWFDLGSFAMRVTELAKDAAGDGGGWDVTVGVGGTVERLVEVRLAVDRARYACTVAQRLPHHRPVAQWDDLGSLGPLAGLGDEALATLCDPEPVKRLLAADPEGVLLQTLRTYLDRGCDAQATAKELFLHRASLYHRLHRIEALAGIDLKDGDQRLLVHMALRARLLLRHSLTSQVPATPVARPERKV